jgi:hypothetical protein
MLRSVERSLISDIPVLESVPAINRTSSEPRRTKRLSLEDDIHRTRFIRVARVAFSPDIPLLLFDIDACPIVLGIIFAKFADQVINVGASDQSQTLILVDHRFSLSLLLHEGRKAILPEVHPGLFNLSPVGVVARGRWSLEESIADIDQVCILVDLGGGIEASWPRFVEAVLVNVKLAQPIG